MSNAAMVLSCGPHTEISSWWDMWGSENAVVNSLATHPFTYSYRKTQLPSKPKIRIMDVWDKPYTTSNLHPTCVLARPWHVGFTTSSPTVAEMNYISANAG